MITLCATTLVFLSVLTHCASAQEFQVTRIDGWSQDLKLPYPYIVVRNPNTLNVSYFRLFEGKYTPFAKISTDRGLTWQDQVVATTPDGPVILYLATPDSTDWYQTLGGKAIYYSKAGAPLVKLPWPDSTYRHVSILGLHRYIVTDSNSRSHLLVNGHDSLFAGTLTVEGNTWVRIEDELLYASWDDGITWTEPLSYRNENTKITLRLSYVGEEEIALLGSVLDGYYVGSQYLMVLRRDGSVIRHTGEHGSEGARSGGHYGWFHRFQDSSYAAGTGPQDFDHFTDVNGWRLYGARHGSNDPTASVAAKTLTGVYLINYSRYNGRSLWRVDKEGTTSVELLNESPSCITWLDNEINLSPELLNLHPAELVVHDLTGRLVLQLLKPESRTYIALPKGVFVVSVYFSSTRLPMHQRIVNP